MNNNQIKEECLTLQYKYLEKYRNGNTNLDDGQIIVQIFPVGWFSNNNFSEKKVLLQQALMENKNLRDYPECYKLLHPRDF